MNSLLSHEVRYKIYANLKEPLFLEGDGGSEYYYEPMYYLAECFFEMLYENNIDVKDGAFPGSYIADCWNMLDGCMFE